MFFILTLVSKKKKKRQLQIVYVHHTIYSVRKFNFFSSEENLIYVPNYTVVYREGPGQDRNGEKLLGNSDRKMGLWACRFLRSRLR